MTKWILAPILIVVINVLWLAGGQGWLYCRRELLPIITASYAYFAGKNRAKRWIAGIFVVFAIILSCGYGTSSWLMRLCRGSETAVRAVMASLISLVFAAYLVCSHGNLFYIPVILVLNLIAWEIRAGSVGKVLGKDILVPDICRATAFSISVLLCV